MQPVARLVSPSKSQRQTILANMHFDSYSKFDFEDFEYGSKYEPILRSRQVGARFPFWIIRKEENG